MCARSVQGVTISDIENTHNASQFGAHLKIYLNSFLNHQLGWQRLEQAVLPIDTVDVYHQFQFQPESLHNEEEAGNTMKALPRQHSQKFGWYDTVVVMDTEDAEATGRSGLPFLSFVFYSVSIFQVCMLAPVFEDRVEEQKWTPDNVLELADAFRIKNWAKYEVNSSQSAPEQPRAARGLPGIQQISRVPLTACDYSRQACECLSKCKIP
ncbi:hypothetical protein FA15DRAFT_661331 [Coprinopsis marcescibilis]|uniref:DUF6830 domain-containing protein n=1 Tax=Coprinopsis marcescibilis TaxID=230819 RepID=A0A5C3KBZ0_COPMA|nr:hypothetical protein FA15DRAFT_661331 [Coprinopsis marcescibilis]